MTELTDELKSILKVTPERIQLAKTLEENLKGTEYESVQNYINDGIWGLEGSVGRYMNDCIASGICMLGETHHYDYWGNRIPSRWEVKAGTKGSPEFVEEHQFDHI